MSVETDNITAKEYNRINKYKDLEIEIEKQQKNVVIQNSYHLIKKGTDKRIKKIRSSFSL